MTQPDLFTGPSMLAAAGCAATESRPSAAPASRQLRNPTGPTTLTTRVREYLLAHPGEWLSSKHLAWRFGVGGWRTELSRCRRRFKMDIQKQRREKGGYDYRYVPDGKE